MRFVLIDGSPESAQGVTKDLIQRYLPCIKGNEYGILYARDEDHDKDAMILNAADAVIIFSPVYNGGLPDRMLAFLSHLLTLSVKALPVAVYLHTDLYDPQMCSTALAFMKNWMKRMGWNSKIGVVIGGDRLLTYARISEAGEALCSRIDRVMTSHADVFAKGEQSDVYVKVPVPRIVYGPLAERWLKEENEKDKKDFQK